MSDAESTVAAKPSPRYFDRHLGKFCQERVLGDGALRWAYCSPIRGMLQWPLFGCALFSQLMGWYLDRRCSCRRIEPTIQELGIDMSQVKLPQGGFKSFNDFFIRELQEGARPLPEDGEALISPAESRLTVYPRLDGDTVVPVKGVKYTVKELLGAPGADVAESFQGGALMVCRLCPADYHRYHFVEQGKISRRYLLRGKYHSVNPLALEAGYPVFTGNVRSVTLLELTRGVTCAMIAVGAFGVAGIHEPGEAGTTFNRGEEAGYFTFGGSTVIMIFPPNSMEFDSDISELSAQGIETLVRVNSSIGRWTTPGEKHG